MLYLLACLASKDNDHSSDTTSTSTEEYFSCPTGEFDQELGIVEHQDITETSGLAVSRYNPNQLWVHNDSGDEGRLFLLDKSGDHLGELDLNVDAIDWEDIGIIQSTEDSSYLYIGDIGDNEEERENIVIHRVREPTSITDPPEVTSFTLTYPDQPHNAESLVVHPHTGKVYILTKDLEKTQIFVWNEEEGILQETNRFSFPALEMEGSPLLTAADISPDGRTLLIRTYTAIWAFDANILDGSAIETVCDLPSPAEQQGEAISFSQDGSHYLSISEGSAQSIFQFSLSFANP